MPPRKILYLLRRPIMDQAELLLPSLSTTTPSGTCSLVLLEEAVSSSVSFPGQVYVLRSVSDSSVGHAGQSISYRDLVTLIAEHDATIVL